MSLSILVVDDSMVMRNVIIKTLQLSGLPIADVFQASNGEEGLKVLQNNWIDLALVDINMPVMNGVEMLKRIRHDPETEHLSVIVVSRESSSSRIKAFKEHNAGFVHKPFTPERLKDEVMNTITGGLDEKY